MFPRFRSRNMVSFLSRTSIGKYFSRNIVLKFSQVISIPTTSNLWRALSHKFYASSASISVSNRTFYASEQTITLKIFSISCSQLWALSGSYLTLKVDELFLWNFPNPQIFFVIPCWFCSAWFTRPITWAIAFKALAIARSFLPVISMHTSKQPFEETLHRQCLYTCRILGNI